MNFSCWIINPSEIGWIWKLQGTEHHPIGSYDKIRTYADNGEKKTLQVTDNAREQPHYTVLLTGVNRIDRIPEVTKSRDKESLQQHDGR